MTLGDAKDSVSCIAVFEAEIYAGSVDGRIRIYDIRMGSVSIDVIGSSVTSITPTRRNDAFLVSALDSRILLLDRNSGKILQAFKSSNFTNTSYRLRSTLALNDSIALSGSEDGRIIAWDVVEGRVICEVWHDKARKDESVNPKRKVISSVVECPARNEWCSAGGDGVVVVWGHRKLE